MKVEVLYIDGCPHFPITVDAVKKCLGQLDLICPITEMSVADRNTAVQIGFLRIANRPHQWAGHRAISTPENSVWDDVPHV